MVMAVTEGGTRFFQDEKGYTIYADCHGLKKGIYQKRQAKRQYWGQLKQTVYEEIDEASYASESESVVDEGIGNLQESDQDVDFYK